MLGIDPLKIDKNIFVNSTIISIAYTFARFIASCFVCRKVTHFIMHSKTIYQSSKVFYPVNIDTTYRMSLMIFMFFSWNSTFRRICVVYHAECLSAKSSCHEVIALWIYWIKVADDIVSYRISYQVISKIIGFGYGSSKNCKGWKWTKTLVIFI